MEKTTNTQDGPIEEPPLQEEKSDTERKAQESNKVKRPFRESLVYFVAAFVLCVAVYACTVKCKETKAAITGVLSMLAPFIIALFIAYFLNPLITWIYRKMEPIARGGHVKARRVISLVLAYVIFLGGITLLLIFIIPQVAESIMELVVKLPTLGDELYEILSGISDQYDFINLDGILAFADENLPELLSYAEEVMTGILPQVYSVVGSALGWVVDILLSFVVSCYIVSDKDSFKLGFKRILYSFLPEKTAEKTLSLIKESNEIFASYMIGKALDSLIMGILCAIVMSIFRLPYVVLTSVIIGVTNMIPFFGPIIGAIPGAVLMLLSGPMECLIFLIIILALQQFDGNILGPKILGNFTGVKPVWIIFGVTAGGYLGGVLGMFLGVPIVAVLANLLHHLTNYLLGRRSLTPETRALLEPQKETSGQQHKQTADGKEEAGDKK